LGNTGMKVSRICLGTMGFGDPKGMLKWALDEESSRPIIKRALDLGVNFFDTADMYSKGVSEEILGRAIKDYANRDDVVIATKVFAAWNDKPNQRGLSRKHIMQAIDASLKRLGTDYVDLYQIHRWDNDTPIEETMEVLHDLVRSGKVRYIGASTMYAWQFSKAQNIAEERGLTKFVTMQNLYNLVYREEEREMNPLCKDQKVGLIPWSPLAGGLLCGNRQKTEDFKGDSLRATTSSDFMKKLFGQTQDNDFEIIDRVKLLASKKNVTPSQISLAWLLNKPGVTAPIVGASKMEHLEEAVASLNVELSQEDMTYLEELYKPHSVVGFYS